MSLLITLNETQNDDGIAFLQSNQEEKEKKRYLNDGILTCVVVVFTHDFPGNGGRCRVPMMQQSDRR